MTQTLANADDRIFSRGLFWQSILKSLLLKMKPRPVVVLKCPNSSTCSIALLFAVKLDVGVRLHRKSPTIPVVFWCFQVEVIAFPSGCQGGTQEPLECVWDYSVIRENISASALLQTLLCKVNSSRDNTETLGVFRSDAVWMWVCWTWLAINKDGIRWISLSTSKQINLHHFVSACKAGFYLWNN